MSSFEPGNSWIKNASKAHARQSSTSKVANMGKKAPDMMGNRSLENRGGIAKLAIKNAASGSKSK